MTYFSGRKLLSTARKLACALLIATPLVVASHAYAGYNLWTGDYTFSHRDLQNAIATRFPRDLTYMGIFQVRLSNPQLSFDEAGNRLITQVDARIESPLSAPVNGVLAVSSGLKYDPVSRAVQLDAPRAEKVNVAGVPAEYGGQMQALGGMVADQVLRDYPLYTFTPEQLQFNGKHIEPGKITVRKDGLSVEIRQ